MHRILPRYEDDSHNYHRNYIKCELLIIDDWLLDPVKTKQTRELLEVVESRIHIEGEESMRKRLADRS